VVAYVLGVTMALHVLAVLFTYWSVSFNALVNYKTVTALADAEYVQVSGSGSSFLAAVLFLGGSMLHGHFRQTTMALPTRVEPGEPHKL
jgi:hypothetical protein